jgi:hypothetical protein
MTHKSLSLYLRIARDLYYLLNWCYLFCIFHIFVREPKLYKSLTENDLLYGSTGKSILSNVFRSKSLSFSYCEDKENKSKIDECFEDKRKKQTILKSENDKIVDRKTNIWSDWFENINFYKVVRITIY